MDATLKYSEEELVALLKSKGSGAFSIIYDSYSAALYGVINRIIDDKELSADILQEIFIKIWKNSDSYDDTKGRLFTWLINIARNTAIDTSRSRQYKAEQKNQKLDNSVKSVNRAGNSTINTDIIGLKNVVGQLKPEYKEIIDLLFYGGFTQEEAARKLDIPLGTVKTRSRTALIQLRLLLKEKN